MSEACPRLKHISSHILSQQFPMIHSVRSPSAGPLIWLLGIAREIAESNLMGIRILEVKFSRRPVRKS